jgi:phytol kinase
MILTDELINNIPWVFILSLYAMLITLGTKKLYDVMVSRGMEKNVAIYYDRKIVHMFAGGIVVLLVPFIFTNKTSDYPYVYPLIIGLILTIFTYIPHKTGKILYWLQTKDNRNDVNFCLMWALIVFILWILIGDPWIAIIPPSFMAFGDGVTGIARNAFFKKRTKSAVGNVFMVLICIPLGYFLAGNATPSIPWWGVIAALVASFVERYEFGPIDDNVLISVSATIILYIGFVLGPITNFI